MARPRMKMKVIQTDRLRNGVVAKWLTPEDEPGWYVVRLMQGRKIVKEWWYLDYDKAEDVLFALNVLDDLGVSFASFPT